ncbi:MAG: hypothetical protein MJ177_05545, partial [Clostridia bacterium]|nr:hypothetical protein [Clostridia bacterium]
MNRLKDKFIEMPNLPQSAVASAIIGEEHGKEADLLEKSGIRLYYSQKNEFVHPCAGNHADMAAYCLGNGKIILEKKQDKLYFQLKKDGFDVSFTDKYADGEYPSDILLNCFTVKNKLYCKKSSADFALLSSYKDIEDVKQGYAKCS